jgi:hypothetical protein
MVEICLAGSSAQAAMTASHRSFEPTPLSFEPCLKPSGLTSLRKVQAQLLWIYILAKKGGVVVGSIKALTFPPSQGQKRLPAVRIAE